MDRRLAEQAIDFHCSDPNGVMTGVRTSLKFDEQGFSELLAAIVSLEGPYGSQPLIPRRVAGCLAGLSEEIRGMGSVAERNIDQATGRRFQHMASQVSDAISRALWPGTERLNEFGVNPVREGSARE